MAEVKGKWDERQALPGNNGLFDINRKEVSALRDILFPIPFLEKRSHPCLSRKK
jgi:hypothetical protein